MTLPPACAAPVDPPAAPPGVRSALVRLRRVLHRIIGVPDYEAYVHHMRARHPGAPVLDARAFERERLAARYERPGSRCC